MNQLTIDASWTLFLDRDGVINTRKMGGYIQSVEEFEFLPGAKEAIAEFSNHFRHIFVVTNQQGIGKGIMTESNLLDIHSYMQNEVKKLNGSITKCYFAPDLASDENTLRKPKTGMGLLAKTEFPEVDFKKSIMVGDSDSDIQFGINLGMTTVRIKTVEPIKLEADFTFNSLQELQNWIIKK